VDFVSWLKTQTDRPDEVGDLARDVVADVAAGCGVWVSSVEDVRDHVEGMHGGMSEVLDSVRVAEWEHRKNSE
jgi:hypothetical protein